MVVTEYEKFLSTEAKKIIKDADLDRPVEDAFNWIAAGKPNQPKKNHLATALEYIMKFSGWNIVSGEKSQEIEPVKSDEKPFSCTKCDKTFCSKNEAEKCCEQGTSEVNESAVDDNELTESEISTQETPSNAQIAETIFGDKLEFYLKKHLTIMK